MCSVERNSTQESTRKRQPPRRRAPKPEIRATNTAAAGIEPVARVTTARPIGLGLKAVTPTDRAERETNADAGVLRK
jgi:hypothetical protein